MLSDSQRSARKSLIRSRAIALGLVSVAAFLSRSPFSNDSAQSAGDANASTGNSSGENPAKYSPVPADSRSPFACELLSRGEKARVAAEVRALHLADDHAAYMVGRADGSPASTWLALVPAVAS